MTMDKMNQYLIDRGFEVLRQYDRTRHEYKFTISKCGITKVYYWKYPKTNLGLSENQRESLNNMINDFHSKLSLDDYLNPACKTLCGSIDTGYYYTTTTDMHHPKIETFKPEMDEFEKYRIHDVEMLKKLIKRRLNMNYGLGYVDIKDVIFNDPVTIVFWNDGTKTVVKAVNEPFDKEKGIAMAIAKKYFGNKGNYYNHIKKWLD